MKKKCMSCGGSMKKMAKGGQTIVGMPGYNATTRPMQMKKGGTKPPCPPGYHMEGGDCVKDPKAFDSTGAKVGFFGALTGALGLGAKIAVDSQRERNKNKINRLKEREAKLVSRGYKAVDEGREKKADRILGRAARVENRIINLEEKKAAKIKKMAPNLSPAKPVMKRGGATKATKFAALAPPYNKATAADRIAGAKKNARKKK